MNGNVLTVLESAALRLEFDRMAVLRLAAERRTQAG